MMIAAVGLFVVLVSSLSFRWGVHVGRKTSNIEEAENFFKAARMSLEDSRMSLEDSRGKLEEVLEEDLEEVDELDPIELMTEAPSLPPMLSPMSGTARPAYREAPPAKSCSKCGRKCLHCAKAEAVANGTVKKSSKKITTFL